MSCVRLGRMHQQKPAEQKHLRSPSCFFFLMGTNVDPSQIHPDTNPAKTHVWDFHLLFKSLYLSTDSEAPEAWESWRFRKTQHKNAFLLCKLGWKILVAKDNLLDTSISISGLTRKKTTNHTILLIQEKTSKIVCRNPHFFHFLKLPTKKPQIEATEYRTKQKFQFSVWSPQLGIVFFSSSPSLKVSKRKAVL